jgi:hypothetical protein
LLGCHPSVITTAGPLSPQVAAAHIDLLPPDEQILTAMHRYPHLGTEILAHIAGNADVLRLILIRLQACKLLDGEARITPAGRAVAQTFVATMQSAAS